MPKKPLNNFVKYSSMGMQMLGPILAGVFGGKYLDATFETGKAFTISLSLFGVFAGLYLGLKDFIFPKND